ncbi:MAG: hypothetical protein P4L33_03230 [Capsulimonadaceae bacterium]|nr:hypothetical protein [Capsulimonadaceae bacterium]
MDINRHEDVDRLRAIWQASVQEMRRYEEFYAGHEAQLESNVYYRNSKARAEACYSRIAELGGLLEPDEFEPAVAYN